jgi:Calcium-dependent channel, 7TM region, putative phosphate
MGGVRGVYIFRRYFFNLVGLLLICFLSTPAAIYSSLKIVAIFNWTDFGKNLDRDSFLGSLLITLLPPLVIIFINNILLLMIDYSAYYEKRNTHSKYQFSIFNKAYVYLSLNMLIIPSVMLTSQSSLIEVI